MEVGNASALPTTSLASSTPASSVAIGSTSGGNVAIARRSDGGASLGLFNKIAAARKEKLAPVRDDLHADLSATSPEKRASTAAALMPQSASGSSPSHFPEIHDASARAAVARVPLNPRKVTARTFAQNLRWTKQGFGAEENAKASLAATQSSGSPPRRSTAISPVVRNVQPDRLQPQQLQRRSVFDIVSVVAVYV